MPAPISPTALFVFALDGARFYYTIQYTNNEPGAATFFLDSATDTGFTGNLISQAMPVGAMGNNDVVMPVLSNNLYYRVRLVNGSGSSVSNTASMTIPNRYNIETAWINPVSAPPYGVFT